MVQPVPSEGLPAFIEYQQHGPAGAPPAVAYTSCCSETDEFIHNGWLVERHHHCTCGDGQQGRHEPGCNLIPIVNLSEMEGYAAEEKAEIERLKALLATYVQTT